MFKTTFGQDYILVTIIVSLVVAVLVAHTMIPGLAIGIGFLAGMILPRLFFKGRWGSIQIPEWKKYVLSGLVSLISSQSGWVALLI